MKKKKEKRIVFEALSHPIRIRLIELLAERGAMGFSELKDELNISTGSIYHHLSMLSDFITQNEQRKYILNDDGKKLARLIKENKFMMNERDDNLWDDLKNFFNGAILPIFFSNYWKLAFIITPILAILNIFGLFYSSLNFKLLFLTENRLSNIFNYTLNFIFNWIIIYLILELMAYIILRNRGNDLILFFIIPICLYPLSIFIYLFNFINFLNENIIRLIFVFFQGWSFITIVRALQSLKSMDLQQALISCLVLYFASVLVFLSF